MSDSRSRRIFGKSPVAGPVSPRRTLPVVIESGVITVSEVRNGDSIMRMLALLRCVLGDKRGISAVEYGILVGVVGVALAGVMGTMSTGISEYITNSVSTLTAPASGVDGDGAGG
jgi:Flp pilus assembly pilin Flp